MKTYTVTIEIRLKQFPTGSAHPTDWIEATLDEQLEAGEYVEIHEVEEITA